MAFKEIAPAASAATARAGNPLDQEESLDAAAAALSSEAASAGAESNMVLEFVSFRC